MLRHRDTGFRLYLQSASLCLRNAGMEARDFIRVRLHEYYGYVAEQYPVMTDSKLHLKMIPGSSLCSAAERSIA